MPSGRENAISMNDLARLLNCDERCVRALLKSRNSTTLSIIIAFDRMVEEMER